MKHSAFTVRGKLGPLPAAIWNKGSSRFSFLDIGDERFDNCWVLDYIVGNVENSVHEEVELSFCRLDKQSLHLCAIKKSTGRIERIPDPSPRLFRDMAVTALIAGLITFLSTWFIAPFLLVIPFFVLPSFLSDLGEKILAPLMFAGFFSIWAAQLVWVLFFSKRLSPKVRLALVNRARTAFD
jgi:hypothetical protein